MTLPLLSCPSYIGLETGVLLTALPMHGGCIEQFAVGPRPARGRLLFIGIRSGLFRDMPGQLLLAHPAESCLGRVQPAALWIGALNRLRALLKRSENGLPHGGYLSTSNEEKYLPSRHFPISPTGNLTIDLSNHWMAGVCGEWLGMAFQPFVLLWVEGKEASADAQRRIPVSNSSLASAVALPRVRSARTLPRLS